MNKRRGLLVTLILIILIIFSFSYYNISNEKKQMESNLKSYLFDVKNYSETDIKELYINHQWFKTGEYHAIVIFEDEPSIKYIYGYNSNKEIYQMGLTKVGNHAD
jgi:hypothetical protein